MTFDPQASELNVSIKNANPHIFDMLSRRGKSIFFPKLGILSQSAEANGKDINATIGTALEDDRSVMCLNSLSKRLNLTGKASFGYAPSYGKPEIRSAWKEMLVKKNPALADVAISQPVVTCALTHGLSMAGYLFVDEGDKIIMPDLYWENYDLVFSNAFGGRFVTYPTFEKKGYNVKGLRKALLAGKPGKRIVLLNFPNNPTGYTLTVQEGKEIYALLTEAAEKGNTIVVLIDDAYFGLVFEKGVMTESIFSSLAIAHERILAVKFDGPTKEDYVWGFRVGFVTFGCKTGTTALYTPLEAKLAGAIRGNISNASNLSQTLLTAAYAEPEYAQEKAQKFAVLKKRYERIRTILANHPEYREAFDALPFNSGYFMCVRIKSGNAEKIRQTLLSNYSTGVIAFGDIIRVAFSSTPIDLLDKLFNNIYRACMELA